LIQIQLGAFVQKRILDEREGKMTRSSAVRATDIEANDLGEDKLTSSRASTSIPFDNMRYDDEEEEDFFDAEAGWYVPIFFRYTILETKGKGTAGFGDVT
jgi:hypothetical protein